MHKPINPRKRIYLYLVAIILLVLVVILVIYGLMSRNNTATEAIPNTITATPLPISPTDTPVTSTDNIPGQTVLPLSKINITSAANNQTYEAS